MIALLWRAVVDVLVCPEAHGISLIALLCRRAQDARLAQEEQEVVAIYKALKEQRHKARVMADRAADAAQQLAEAQRRLDIVNSAAAAAPVANGARAEQQLCSMSSVSPGPV